MIILSGNSWKIIQGHEDDSAGWVQQNHALRGERQEFDFDRAFTE